MLKYNKYKQIIQNLSLIGSSIFDTDELNSDTLHQYILTVTNDYSSDINPNQFFTYLHDIFNKISICFDKGAFVIPLNIPNSSNLYPISLLLLKFYSNDNYSYNRSISQSHRGFRDNKINTENKLCRYTSIGCDKTDNIIISDAQREITLNNFNSVCTICNEEGKCNDVKNTTKRIALVYPFLVISGRSRNLYMYIKLETYGTSRSEFVQHGFNAFTRYSTHSRDRSVTIPRREDSLLERNKLPTDRDKLLYDNFTQELLFNDLSNFKKLVDGKNHELLFNQMNSYEKSIRQGRELYIPPCVVEILNASSIMTTTRDTRSSTTVEDIKIKNEINERRATVA